MISEPLIGVLETLSEEDQEAVRRFAESLANRQKEVTTPFLRAADEIIREHPELLRRLAQ